MNIREIENSIIEKLKSSFSELLIQGFPDKPAEFILLHPIGALLIHYQGSNYTSTNALNFITQENKKEFSITVVTRNLRSNKGAYEFIDGIKSVLTGFSPDGCSKLSPSKDFFISEKGGIWQYGVNFTLTTTNVQNF